MWALSSHMKSINTGEELASNDVSNENKTDSARFKPKIKFNMRIQHEFTYFYHTQPTSDLLPNKGCAETVT